MEKKNTPLQMAIDEIKKIYDNENITGFSKRAYAQCLDILESKLPIEREVIEKAITHTFHDIDSEQSKIYAKIQFDNWFDPNPNS